MDDNFKTSQTDWSLTEGSSSASAPAVQHGDEPTGAPGPVTQPVKGEIIGKGIPQSTSQQQKSEHDKPEGK